MPLALTCDCGARFEVDDALAGQEMNCPECQKTIPPHREELESFAILVSATCTPRQDANATGEVEPWLTDEAVTASRDPWLGRAKHWMWRQRTAVIWVAAVSATALGLAMGTVLLLAVKHWIREARGVASRQRDEAGKRAEVGENAGGWAGDPSAQVRVSNELGNRLNDMGRLEEAEAAYRQALALSEQLTREFPDDPAHRSALAVVQTNLGRLLSARGQDREAEDAYRQAVAVQEELVRDFPGVTEYRSGLALSQSNLGCLLSESGRVKEAEAAYRQALDLRAELARKFPYAPEYRSDLALSQNNLGCLLRQKCRFKEAEAAYRQALALCEQLVRDIPADPKYRSTLAFVQSNMGAILSDKGQVREAEAAYRQAIATREKLARDFPTITEHRSALAFAQNNLGRLLYEWGRPEEAEAACRQALTVQGELAREFPDAPEHRCVLARVHTNLGLLLRKSGRVKEAEAAFQQALALREPLARNFPTPDRRLDLAAVRAHLGYHAEAVAEANTLAEGEDATPVTLYNAACVCGLAAASVKADARLADQYAARAVALLRKAEQAGYFTTGAKVKHMKKDSDLDSLRSRDVFKKLVADLEGGLGGAD